MERSSSPSHHSVAVDKALPACLNSFFLIFRLLSYLFFFFFLGIRCGDRISFVLLLGQVLSCTLVPLMLWWDAQWYTSGNCRASAVSHPDPSVLEHQVVQRAKTKQPSAHFGGSTLPPTSP